MDKVHRAWKGWRDFVEDEKFMVEEERAWERPRLLRGGWRVARASPLKEWGGRRERAHMLARTPREPNYTRLSLQ
jgi:hypothetical protein